MAGDITIFSPDLVVPWADTWQAGVTRAIGSTMSVEARYLGARSRDSWRTNDYNELNINENGFLDEFKLAMTNLQANNAAGGTRAGSFAYFGPGTGTVPLPIILADTRLRVFVLHDLQHLGTTVAVHDDAFRHCDLLRGQRRRLAANGTRAASRFYT